MGFRFKRIDFTGKAGEWGSSSTPRKRAESVVRAVARAITGSSTGWTLDTDRNETEADFCEVPCMDSDGDTMPGLFLENEATGDKLFIAYLATRCDRGIDLPTAQLVPYGEITAPSYTGLIMAMIPGESGDSFGNTFGAQFLPSTATRIYGTAQGYGKTNLTAYARHNGADVKYSWGIFATQNCVAVACGNSDTEEPAELKMCFACGKLFDYLAQNETTAQAKYGVVQFTLSTGGTNAEGGVPKITRVDFGDATEDVYCSEPITRPYSEGVGGQYAVKSAACIVKADGAPIGHTATANVRIYPENCAQLSQYTKSADANIRWIPFTVSVVSTNLQADGIVPGDGLKGYLDTDLFRCARAARGQYFNNKQFMGAGACLLIGWHPDNEDEF